MWAPSGVCCGCKRSPAKHTQGRGHMAHTHFVGEQWPEVASHFLDPPMVALGPLFKCSISQFLICGMGRVSPLLGWLCRAALSSRDAVPSDCSTGRKQLEPGPALPCLQCSMPWENGIQTCSTALQAVKFHSVFVSSLIESFASHWAAGCLAYFFNCLSC